MPAIHNGKSLGSRVQQKRLHAGLSLRQAALQIGISPATLMRIEKAEQEPGTDTLSALAEWLEDPTVAADVESATVEAHLRAEKNMSRDLAGALARLFDAASHMRWPKQQVSPRKKISHVPRFQPAPLTGYARQVENLAKSIRKTWGVDEEQAFEPLELARALGITIATPNDVSGVSDEDLHLLLEVFSDRWSAGTISLSDGRRVIIVNPKHSPEREKATLMEEICHVLFDHQPTSIAPYLAAGQVFRDYNKEQEKEAYWVGAAVLMPYGPLAQTVRTGGSVSDLAAQYGVSEPLAKFRIKITGLWPLYVNSGV